MWSMALEDDATLALASAQQPKRRKRKQAPEVEQVLLYSCFAYDRPSCPLNSVFAFKELHRQGLDSSLTSLI